MASSSSKVRQFILHSLVPIACSIVVGFIFYAEGVFNPYHGSFQFVWSAVVASLFYYLLLFVRSRDAYLGLIILIGFTILETGARNTTYILRDIFYIGAIGTAVILYVKYFKQHARSNYFYTAVVLAGLYGMASVVAADVHLAIVQLFGMGNTSSSFVRIASTTSFFGMLIGFAVGGGITVAEKIFGSIKNASVVS